MRDLLNRFFPLLFACTSIASCAGYRGGWESFAYIGDTPPAAPPEARTPYEASVRNSLAVPGLRLHVTINNQLQTHDTQLYLYVIPLPGNPGGDSQQSEPGKTRVSIRVTPTEPGFVFSPALAVLGLAGESFGGAAGHEFGQWDAEGRRIERGGAWGYRRIESEFHLDEVGRPYHLSIDFDTPMPSPRSRDITLDLSRALRSPERPPIPLIRFAPIRWSESYS